MLTFIHRNDKGDFFKKEKTKQLKKQGIFIPFTPNPTMLFRTICHSFSRQAKLLFLPKFKHCYASKMRAMLLCKEPLRYNPFHCVSDHIINKHLLLV